jgi:hypothetical protein
LREDDGDISQRAVIFTVIGGARAIFTFDTSHAAHMSTSSEFTNAHRGTPP